ncbi:hypothetical protein MMSR116_29105 [Methylobacterium mesophilicum SR1.6/6]|uniref:Uncharacterized protein n=1 Tax=Methylobacterium mesophilicum SR1.6/6 TaxID=908290 RepID=A0A6B9FY75_9HYPH|nr:hypothetical protein [Methylobacterium mesophilicum]QGY05498.1 hypothetical protein MMSR116_29105 [Methylobacterium mesophilicum SR1.6/6]
MHQRQSPADRPQALCIQELRHGGYVVTAFPHFHHEVELLAAFTRLSDAVSWMEDAMRGALAEAKPEAAAGGVLG